MENLKNVFEEYAEESDQSIKLKFVSFENPDEDHVIDFIEFEEDESGTIATRPGRNHSKIYKLTDQKSQEIYNYLVAKKVIGKEFLVIQSNEELRLSDLMHKMMQVKYCRIFEVVDCKIYNTYFSDNPEPEDVQPDEFKDELKQQIITYLEYDTESG